MQIEMIPVAIDDDIEADSVGFEDLGQAMSNGHISEMERCVAAILETPARVMPPEQKFRLLWLSGGLYGAFSHAQADTAARFTRLVASAPSSALEPLLQLKLLLWPVTTRLEFDVPLLHSIATARQLQGVHRDLRVHQHRTIFGYVHEIAASGNLSVAFKTMLCAAMHGNPATTAAQTALANDNPGAAAAMMCGILSASPDALLSQILLQYLGVSPRDVLSALVATAHREDAQWGPLLLALLDESGLPREEIDPLMRDFAVPEVG
jgi:hypothetical protein